MKRVIRGHPRTPVVGLKILRMWRAINVFTFHRRTNDPNIMFGAKLQNKTELLDLIAPFEIILFERILLYKFFEFFTS